MGKGGVSCTDACSTNDDGSASGKVCSNTGLWQNQVNSQSEFTARLQSGFTCNQYTDRWGDTPDSPNIAVGTSSTCYGSIGYRPLVTFDCTVAVPGRSRLCVCHEESSLLQTDPGQTQS